MGLLGSSLLNHFGGLVSSDRSDKAGSVSSGSASPTSKLSIVDVAVGSDSHFPGTCGVWGPFVGAKRGQAVTGYASCLNIQAAGPWVGHLMVCFQKRTSATRTIDNCAAWSKRIRSDPRLLLPGIVYPRNVGTTLVKPNRPFLQDSIPLGLAGQPSPPSFRICLFLSF